MVEAVDPLDAAKVADNAVDTDSSFDFDDYDDSNIMEKMWELEEMNNNQ